MVLYLDVQDFKDIVQIGIDENGIAFLTKRYRDTEDDLSEYTEMVVESEEDLMDYVPIKDAPIILQALFDYCLKYKLIPEFTLSSKSIENFLLQYVPANDDLTSLHHICQMIYCMDNGLDIHLMASTGTFLDKSAPTLYIPIKHSLFGFTRQALFNYLFEQLGIEKYTSWE